MSIQRIGETRSQQWARLEREGKILTPAKRNTTVGSVPPGECFKRGWYWYRVWNTGTHVVCSPGESLPERCKHRDLSKLFSKAVILHPSTPCEYTLERNR
jgi:hypothetical protein